MINGYISQGFLFRTAFIRFFHRQKRRIKTLSRRFSNTHGRKLPVNTHSAYPRCFIINKQTRSNAEYLELSERYKRCILILVICCFRDNASLASQPLRYVYRATRANELRGRIQLRSHLLIGRSCIKRTDMTRRRLYFP